MSSDVNFSSGLSQTLRALEKLLRVASANGQELKCYYQMGFHGYSFTISSDHIHYFNNINSQIVQHNQFHQGIVDNWKTLNEFILKNYQLQGSGIAIDLTSIAAFIAFPLLEEVTRVITNRWDEDGNLLREISGDEGIISWKENGLHKVEKRTDTIVSSLEIKFQLMVSDLSVETREIINSVEKVLKRPMIEGLRPEMSPLSARLYYWRNKWMHGQRFEGWESILVSLLIGVIYFSESRNA